MIEDDQKMVPIFATVHTISREPIHIGHKPSFIEIYILIFCIFLTHFVVKYEKTIDSFLFLTKDHYLMLKIASKVTKVGPKNTKNGMFM